MVCTVSSLKDFLSFFINIVLLLLGIGDITLLPILPLLYEFWTSKQRPRASEKEFFVTVKWNTVKAMQVDEFVPC
jgi:hypothetical protein